MPTPKTGRPQPKKRTLGHTSSAVVDPPFPANFDEDDSPETHVTDGLDAVPKNEQLPEPVVKNYGQEEKEDPHERDIHAEAVLAYSIENPEACLMHSG